MKDKILRHLEDKVSAVGFGKLPEPFLGLEYVISLCIRLSDPVVNEISDKPTQTYFHHYRCTNRLLDDAAASLGLLLQKNGYSFYPVAASQSVHGDGFRGIYSHKQAACLCGMGSVGKNNLFIHETLGVRVRLATVFTDCSVADRVTVPEEYRHCADCGKCISACPAHAVSENGFDPKACSEYMKRNFQLIGRGSVCGICMKVCPHADNRKF